MGVAERRARSLAEEGAEAVAVVGSHAGGGATPRSDLDLAVVGDGPHYRLELHGDLLVSLGCAPAAEQRRRLYEPAYLATHVPGWQRALLVHDPTGVAAAIQREARGWRWDDVADRCDEWVAEELTGYAEEVHKLTAGVRRGELTVAAVQRSVIVLRLAKLVALRRRILYESENRLWQLVASEMGPGWEQAQAAALALDGEAIEASCAAAIELFRLAVAEVRPLLAPRQLEVVTHALTIAAD